MVWPGGIDCVTAGWGSRGAVRPPADPGRSATRPSAEGAEGIEPASGASIPKRTRPPLDSSPVTTVDGSWHFQGFDRGGFQLPDRRRNRQLPRDLGRLYVPLAASRGGILAGSGAVVLSVSFTVPAKRCR